MSTIQLESGKKRKFHKIFFHGLWLICRPVYVTRTSCCGCVPWRYIWGPYGDVLRSGCFRGTSSGRNFTEWVVTK